MEKYKVKEPQTLHAIRSVVNLFIVVCNCERVNTSFDFLSRFKNARDF